MKYEVFIETIIHSVKSIGGGGVDFSVGILRIIYREKPAYAEPITNAPNVFTKSSQDTFYYRFK
jgi:hypothetical protein